MSGVLKNSATDEYNAMEDLIKTAAAEGNKADWMLPVMGLPNGGRDGSGKYTANGAEIRMRSGVTNTDVYEPWAELQKIIYNTDLSQPETGAYVTLNGVNSPRVPSKEPEYGYDDLDNNAKIWKILSTRLQSGLLDKDSKIGDVSYTVSPIAGGEFGKASITITPQNVDWLKKYVKTDKNPNGILDPNAFNAILDNGLTLITDAESLLSSSVYRNSFQSRVEARVANAGREGVTYKDPLDPDYQITIKKNNITSGEHLIEEQWKLWNPNTKSDTLITNIYSLGSMGKNLERVRDNYFLRTVPVKKQQRQIVYEQNR
jgi:hypothetical protein